jgi:MoaA/NifB/PqqE/SkfB family radical SAM enzyme
LPDVSRYPILGGAAVSITGLCNFKCVHCYASAGGLDGSSFAINEIDSILKELVSRGVLTVFIGGGEPLMHSRVHDVVAAANNAGLHPSLTTNGSLITSDIVHRLAAAGMRHNLYVSLEASNELVNDRIRGSGSFRKAVKGIKTLSHAGLIDFAITMVLSRLNIGEAVNTARLAMDLGARFFNLVKVTRDGRGDANWSELGVTRDEFLDEVVAVGAKYEYVGGYYTENAVFGLKPSNTAVRFIQDDKRLQGFPSGISVFDNGTVRLTPMRRIIGNIKETPLSELIDQCYRSPIVDEYREWLAMRRENFTSDIDKLKKHGLIEN